MTSAPHAFEGNLHAPGQLEVLLNLTQLARLSGQLQLVNADGTFTLTVRGGEPISARHGLKCGDAAFLLLRGAHGPFTEGSPGSLRFQP